LPRRGALAACPRTRRAGWLWARHTSGRFRDKRGRRRSASSPSQPQVGRILDESADAVEVSAVTSSCMELPPDRAWHCPVCLVWGSARFAPSMRPYFREHAGSARPLRLREAGDPGLRRRGPRGLLRSPATASSAAPMRLLLIVPRQKRRDATAACGSVSPSAAARVAAPSPP
jgi:hypothetical protein